MKKALTLAICTGMAMATMAAVTTSCDHPAAKRAVELIAASTAGGNDDIRLEVDATLRGEGYQVERNGATVCVRGARPRSLLYAAGEVGRWLGCREISREPRFRTRMVNFTGGRHGVADWIAATGANVVQLSRKAPLRMVEECKAADVPCYAFLYGCDPMKWNKAKCEAFLEDHPSARGVDQGRSWEKGIMCPSDKWTWEFCGSYIREIADAADYEGVAVTFWDDYGLNCHCKRCRANGMDKFSNQVAALVKCFAKALAPTGKKLLVRTWSSGAPHFLGDEWVYAPGYGGSGGEPMALWGETYKTADRSTIIQTKVYNCDCQPNAPFSMLLGKAHDAGLVEFAEWQITGQTVGLGWLPASVVDHTAWTMGKAKKLVGDDGGVCIYAGGYNNHDYDALDDIMNSINIYAWRQLSWNPDEKVDDIWLEWASPRYGKAAETMARALKLSERASVASFSPLGFGSATESRFDGSLSRREDHIRYTNRHYTPEGQALLAPTKENIAKVVAQKDAALMAVDEMDGLIEKAKGSLNMAGAEPEWYEEVSTRTKWLRTHLLVSKALDGAYWRFRYIRHLKDMAMGDAGVLADIEADYSLVRQLHRDLFAHSPDLKLSFYPDKCGEREISLRSPVPLIRDIHSNAVECVERILGPLR